IELPGNRLGCIEPDIQSQTVATVIFARMCLLDRNLAIGPAPCPCLLTVNENLESGIWIGVPQLRHWARSLVGGQGNWCPGGAASRGSSGLTSEDLPSLRDPDNKLSGPPKNHPESQLRHSFWNPESGI